MELQRKLRRLRLAAGMTTRALAAATGMSQSKISRIDTGRRVPSPHDVEAIAKALKLEREITESLTSTARTSSRGSRARAGFWPWNGSRRMTPKDFGDIQCDGAVLRSSCAGIPLWLQTPDHIALGYDCLPRHHVSRREFIASRLQQQNSTFNDKRTRIALVNGSAIVQPRLSMPLWLSQIDFIEQQIRNDIVQVGIVPSHATLTAPFPSCDLVDDWYGLQEVFGADITHTDARLIRRNLDNFESTSRVAVWGQEALTLLNDLRRSLMIDLREPRNTTQPG